MDFIQQAQQAQLAGGAPAPPLPFNIARIPSPMHSSSSNTVQGIPHEKLPVAQAMPVMQPQLCMPQAKPIGGLSIQLPESCITSPASPQIQDIVMSEGTPQNCLYHSGVTWTEDVRCITPSGTMQRRGSGCNSASHTPVAAVTTPSNVATTHWRTMVCPMPPVKRRPLLPSILTRHGSFDGTPESTSLPSPANLWPSMSGSMPTTPHRSLPSTPAGSKERAAFPSLEGDIPMLGQSFERQLSAMSTDGTPVNSSMRGTPSPIMGQASQRFTRLFSKDSM